MKTPMSLIFAGAALLAAGASLAQEAPFLPDDFIVGRGRLVERQVERASATDGTLATVIAPTFTGADGNISFVRLGNFGEEPIEVDITVLGTPTGKVYGTATYAVVAHASPQYALTTILADAKAGALAGGDNGYTLYASNWGSMMSMQHVIYNGANGFFENVSICRFFEGADYSNLNGRLGNIHTSALGTGYPARIYIHNDTAASVTYAATVYDAASGARIGAVSVPVGANGTFSQPFAWFEEQLGWKPASGQLHANMEVAAPEGSSAVPYIGQFIFNQQLTAYVNMSQRCAP